MLHIGAQHRFNVLFGIGSDLLKLVDSYDAGLVSRGQIGENLVESGFGVLNVA